MRAHPTPLQARKNFGRGAQGLPKISGEPLGPQVFIGLYEISNIFHYMFLDMLIYFDLCSKYKAPVVCGIFMDDFGAKSTNLKEFGFKKKLHFLIIC